MKIIGIYGGPRRHKNTEILLDEALCGAKESGAEIEKILLYPMTYKGCCSCFSCKRKNGNHGICAMKDELSPVLTKIRDADGLILAAPLYYSDAPACMRAFLERFLFSHHFYNREVPKLFPKNIPTGLIWTMNVGKEEFAKRGFRDSLTLIEERILWVTGSLELLHSYETLQFDDYSKYEADKFDEKERRKIRRERFPVDRGNAYQMGKRFASDNYSYSGKIVEIT